ncbi:MULTISPECIES: flagellar hook-associated protein FlgL [unclassified Undibacterium]|uniref:flagellar hook-associated protein FlgL n=1 Tax=unclassified Undibacterium TaxID=2630295 RepID=UPI002AC936B8|nr:MULTISPECIES: flagellar hook-associated protein FlgL [unclassified Undibacterium]MEB0138778.1 flagellar hook-associated protein FlgL [Undibacterium sp. CCC2.1]MEB0170746.1 flagellar hook-associated protein FlgL [Undibacterium sp. CCC1.1]MEB0174635.1 flagellar hook-associated protein FlgL [Undibacterium sp. CCC3.4]MEB0213832.1 flagellar hook-associated protein FlgL [Undibacterium sp. 5I2]WPX42558.1 flagellar hook-associated protein FlgL [Undibacterium sp. CCC3.4]
MRISTSMLFQNGGSQISDLQSAVNRTQQQAASGKKILSPADDPIGSARALVITQAQAINEQYGVNRQYANDNLGIADGVLGNITTTLQNVKTLIVNAGNGTLADSDRAALATELQGNLSSLLSQANSTDATGSYLFSGFSTTTAPYTQTAGGATYNGDQGQRSLQVDTSRQIPMSAPGDQIFGNIRTSANQFNIVSGSANTGTTTAAAVVDPATAASLTGNNYKIAFDNTGVNFTVTNTTTGALVVPSTPYTGATTPQVVKFDGVSVTLAAAPAPGDNFTVQPGNQNIFETLTDAINALKTPVLDSTGRGNLNKVLMQANNNLDASINNVLVARAQGGSSMKEISTLDDAGATTDLAYKASLSSIQDIDYAKTITQLTMQQTTLQAAQQSFVKISSLSLFNYIQ